MIEVVPDSENLIYKPNFIFVCPRFSWSKGVEFVGQVNSGRWAPSGGNFFLFTLYSQDGMVWERVPEMVSLQ